MTGRARILVAAGHHQARISGLFFASNSCGHPAPPTAGLRLAACVWMVERKIGPKGSVDESVRE